MICSHCNAEVSEGSRFCGGCGSSTSSTEPVTMASVEAPRLIGRVIAGRYRILQKLGEGGMGAVFQAEQISLKRTVALKLLRPEVSSNPTLLRRFNAEAEAVAKLRHPNTVSIYDFGQDADGALFIAMELIEGRSLRSVVHREAPLAPRRALGIAAQVAASLADAHAKTIIHRDLKPDNVMLADRGRSRDNVTVLDFGIAKLRDDTRATQHQMTQAGDMLGTPQYMAPEQIRGEVVDGRTDVYSLGCMLYEMLTARMPYEAPTVMALLSKHLLEQAPPPSQRRPELGIPPVLDDLVMRAMAKDPAVRPATMEEYGERIAEVMAGFPAEGTAPRSAMVGAQTPPAYSAHVAGSAAGGGAVPVPVSAPPVMPPPAMPPPAMPAPATTPIGAAPMSGPAQPPPYPMPPPVARGGSSLGMWIVVAILLLGAGGVGIYFAARGGGGTPAPTDAGVRERRDHRDPDDDDDHDHDDDKPDPPDDGDDDKPDRPPRTDPDPWAAKPGPVKPAVPGTVVDIADGVKIVAPPGAKVTRIGDGVMIGDRDTFAVFAGPITEPGDDPDTIARKYASLSGLTMHGTDSRIVGGAPRKFFSFKGALAGVPFGQVALPLLGPGYRVYVVLHFNLAAAQANPKLIQAGEDIIFNRLIIPAPGSGGGAKH